MNESPTTIAAQDAKKHVQAFVEAHGRFRIAILGGGAAATLGTIVPFAHVANVFGGGSSYSIIQGGFYGLLLLALAVLLGIFPIFLKRYEHLRLAIFGLSCAIFGVFFAMWLASSGLASVIGGELGGFSLGFYLSLFGYAAMVVGYYLLQSAEE